MDETPEELAATLAAWCAPSRIAVDVAERRLRFRLDPDSAAFIAADVPVGDAPLRLEGRVRVDAGGLDRLRRDEVVEDVVLTRAGLVDARATADGEAVEIVVVVYPEGLNRHTLLESLFEVQKVGLLVQRELSAAVAAEAAVAALAEVVAEEPPGG